jgi:MATE family, multidrug efflux pump
MSKAFLIEATRLTRLAVPVFISQVALAAMGVADTVMAGRAGSAELAGVAVAQSFSVTALLVQVGLFAALTPIVARFKGAGRLDQVPHTLYQTLWIGVACAAVNMSFLTLAAPAVLARLPIEAAIRAIAVHYLRLLAWGIPGHILYQTMRNLVESLHSTVPSMLVGFIGLLVKLPLNYALIYGYAGMPRLGGAGCGIASAIVFWAMGIVFAAYAARVMRSRGIVWRRADCVPSLKGMGAIASIGLPMALSIVSEALLFTVVALMIAPYGAAVVAGHQVAYVCSIPAYLLPMSLGAAVTIRISEQLGKRQIRSAEFSIRVAMALAILLALATACITWLARTRISAWFIPDSDAQALAAGLLMFCALYQLPDAIQVVLWACLRGYRETGILLQGALAAHWLVGFPLGYFLSTLPLINDRPLMPQGYWIGLVAALTAAALLFALRLRQIQRRTRAAPVGEVSLMPLASSH